MTLSEAVTYNDNVDLKEAIQNAIELSNDNPWFEYHVEWDDEDQVYVIWRNSAQETGSFNYQRQGIFDTSTDVPIFQFAYDSIQIGAIT